MSTNEIPSEGGDGPRGGRPITGADVRSAFKLIDDMRKLRSDYRSATGDRYEALVEPLRVEVRKSRDAGENIISIAFKACGQPGAKQLAIAQICAAVMDVYEEKPHDRN